PPGAALPQAQAAMRLFTARRIQQNPRAADWYNSDIQTLGRTMAGDTRRPLLLLQAAVLLLLLTACANVANLLLTRGLARTREFTLRVALGAPRGRLVRQLLTESTALSACGGLAGVFIAELAVAAARRFGPENLPRLREVSLNPRVLGFAVALSFATGILFGLAPALSAARVRLATALNSGGTRVSGGAHTRLRQALLIAEVALALVLVVGAGLLSRSFENLLRADGGFSPDRVVSFELTLPAQTYTADEQIPPVYQRILAELRRLPGVRAAGLAAVVPMAGAANSTGIRLPGHTLPPRQRSFAAYTIVSPGYFAAAGTPLLRGRDFAASDGPASPPVTVISAAMAARFWPAQNPIGQMVGPGSPQYALTRIIGIVADTKRLSMSEVPGPEMFVLYNQHPWPDMHTMDFLVRSDAPAQTLGPALAAAVHRVDPNLPLANLRTIAELVSESMAGARLALALMAGFGFLALLTAVVGMYSVTAFGVRQREKDIGIRMALGARPRDVFAAVLRQGAALAALGVAVGLIAALGLTRLFAALLYGVAPTDPATFAVVAAILLATALAACYVPARRATRLDPLAALRAE
ncbi:MAG TPA: ADOP family duplicated permease, partial [Terriglobales bacterium]